MADRYSFYIKDDRLCWTDSEYPKLEFYMYVKNGALPTPDILKSLKEIVIATEGHLYHCNGKLIEDFQKYKRSAPACTQVQ